jgi:hypothetical protein
MHCGDLADSYRIDIRNDYRLESDGEMRVEHGVRLMWTLKGKMKRYTHIARSLEESERIDKQDYPFHRAE